jgi:hypothetical protein
MDSQPDKPEKPYKKPRKKRQRVNSGEEPLPSKINVDSIRSLLSKVIMQDMMEKEMSAVRDLEIDSLIATNQEFLKCFVIIGYDLNELPILVFKANSQLQADALSSSITKLVINGSKDG